MLYFGMKLHAVKLFRRMENAGVRTVGGGGADGKAFRKRADIVAVAHPAEGLFRQTRKEWTAAQISRPRPAVFPRNVCTPGLNITAEQLHHELAAVADPEDRDAGLKQGGIHGRCTLLIDAGRAARQDDPDR